MPPGIEAGIAETPAPDAPATSEEPALSLSWDEDAGAVDSMSSEEADSPEPTGEAEPTGEPPDSPSEPESGLDLSEVEGEGLAESTEAEGELAMEPPKAGYLVFPDNTEQPIPPSQWLIGRADLAKFVPDPKKANEISRGHLTVFQEADRFFVEDGATMVQRKPSANKTWLVRGGSRILVTGTGRNELQDADVIDVAELVTLQFVLR